MSGEKQGDAAVVENRLIAERRAKLAALRSKRNAYPNSFRPDQHAGALQEQLADSSREALEDKDHNVAVAGRIMARRGPFMVIQDMTGRIQFYVDKKRLPSETLDEVKTWDIGDIVGGRGPIRRSGKGDLYVYLDSVELLSKSLLARNIMPVKRSPSTIRATTLCLKQVRIQIVKASTQQAPGIR